MEPVRINLCINPERDQVLYQHFIARHAHTPKRLVASAVKADILAFLLSQNGYPQAITQPSTRSVSSLGELADIADNSKPQAKEQAKANESSMAGFVQSAIADGFDVEF